MRRAILVGGCALALTVAALVTALALWLVLLNPTSHREELAAWMSKGLGRKVTVHGGVHLAVYPWLGLQIGQVDVADAAPLGPETDVPPASTIFAYAHAAVVQVRLWPLLARGEVELDRIVLLDPILRLRRDAQGLCNWEDLLVLAGKGAGDPPPAEQTSDRAAGLTLSWRGVSIVNGSLLFDDALRGQRVEVSGIHCTTGEGADFEFSLRCKVNSSRYGDGALETQGRCRVDLAGGNVVVDNATLAFQGSVLPGGVAGNARVPIRLSTGFSLRTDTRTMQLRQAALEAGPERIGLEGQLDGLGLPSMRVSGTVTRQAVADGASADLLDTLSGSTSFLWEPGRIALQDVSLVGRHSRLAGNATLATGDTPLLVLQLDSPRLNLDELTAKSSGSARISLEQTVAALAGGTIPGLPASFQGMPFQTMPVQATVQARELTLFGRTIHQAAVNATLGQSGLAVQLEAQEPNAGRLELAAALNGKGLTATVQAGQLSLGRTPELKGLLGGALVQSGTVDIEVNATAAGVHPTAWRSGWTATGSVAVAGGTLDWGRVRSWFDIKQDAQGGAGSFESLTLQGRVSPVRRNGAEAAETPHTLQAEATLTTKGLQLGEKKSVDAVFRLSGTTSLDAASLVPQSLTGAQADLAVSLPAGVVGKSATTATLKAKGDWDGDRDRLALSSFALKAHGAQASGSLTATKLGASPQVQGQTSTGPLALQTLLPALGLTPPQGRDPRVFSLAEASADWKVDGKRVSLSGLKARLDETTLGGDASFTLGPGGPTSWRFHLQADSLDLDRYRAPASETPASGASDQAKPWDGKFLQSLQIRGSVYCKSLKAYDLHMQEVALNVEGLPGQLRLEPFSCRLAGGRVTAGLAMLAGKKLPGVELSLKAEMTDFELNTVAEALGVGDRLGGLTTLTYSLFSSGASGREHVQQLGGTASIKVANGFYAYYRTIKPEPATATDNSLIQRTQPLPPVQPPRRERTVLNIINAAGTMQFSQGVVRNHDFRMTSDRFTATGAGWLDFPRETVDYALQINPGIIPAFPVYVRGAMDDPMVDDSQGGSLVDAVSELTGTVVRTVLDVLALPLRTLETITPK